MKKLTNMKSLPFTISILVVFTLSFVLYCKTIAKNDDYEEKMCLLVSALIMFPLYRLYFNNNRNIVAVFCIAELPFCLKTASVWQMDYYWLTMLFLAAVALLMVFFSVFLCKKRNENESVLQTLKKKASKILLFGNFLFVVIMIGITIYYGALSQKYNNSKGYIIEDPDFYATSDDSFIPIPSLDDERIISV